MPVDLPNIPIGQRIEWTDKRGLRHEGVVVEPPPVPEMTDGHVFVMETVVSEVPSWVRIDNAKVIE